MVTISPRAGSDQQLAGLTAHVVVTAEPLGLGDQEVAGLAQRRLARINEALRAHDSVRVQLLRVLNGELSMIEGAEHLGVCFSRFHELRDDELMGALDALAPKTVGRPPGPTTPHRRVLEFEAETRTFHPKSRDCSVNDGRAAEVTGRAREVPSN